MSNKNQNNKKLTKSKERVQKHGEVFTPAWIVNDMLAMFPDEVWELGKTFLEPACGEGAFLTEIYTRKLRKINTDIQDEWEWEAAIETSAIYGVELLQDNTEQCIINLMKIFLNFYKEKFPDTQSEDVINSVKFLLDTNIIRGNFLTCRKCPVSCGNKCNKCELILFSEWIPDDNYHFTRKDWSFEGLIKANQLIDKNKGSSLFDAESVKNEIALVKVWQPAHWKEVRYAKN